jgi:PHP family Zn ribbon phosphoesterase
MIDINELIKEVEQWIKDNPNSGLFGNIPNRSCWNCNPAHERLKNVDYPIQCFDCGHIFYKGVQLTTDE